MQTLSLNGVWQMHQMGKEERFTAKIPGTVLSTLLEHKAIPDPYDRMNEYDTRDMFWNDYEFERSFEVPEALLQEDVVELHAQSLDTLAEIYMNGNLVAKTDNMHRTWRISVKDYLKAGENTIRIVFLSAMKYVSEYQPEERKKFYVISDCSVYGNQFIRKAHSMFGWDWGAELIDAGIQRDIDLVGYSDAVLEDVRIHQEHAEGKATVTVEVDTLSWAGEQSVEVALCDPEGTVMDTLSFTPETAPVPAQVTMERRVDGQLLPLCKGRCSFTVENPRLWWPNGYGEHPLYTVKVALHTAKGDQKKDYRIGLRTLTISQDKDEWGEEFCFQVNGLKIFTMGSNYIPEDCVYPRITQERTRRLLQDCVEANYNCIRVWGGGYYPADSFYDLCDELGLIVWQDLMFACNIYDFTPEFEENVTQELRDNVRRLRHHASLGLWCGNNELETAWMNWDDYKCHNAYVKADYIKQFEFVIPKIMKEEDPDTFFWPSSPCSGGCYDDPEDDNRGDVHYWSVWHGMLPFTDYRNHFFRFCSEFGFQSFPCAKTVNTFTREEDRNIFSDVMESHQKNSSANGKLLYYLAENFRYPKDFNSLLYVTQILQANAIKYGVEHWRRNRGRCMGALYWQLNDEWPVASWASIDYFGRWKALHYFARNFFARTTGSLELNGENLKVWLENETFDRQSCELTLRLRRMDLSVILEEKAEAQCESFSSAMILEKDFAEVLKTVDKKDVFIEAVFTYPDGHIQVETEIFVPYKYLHLPVPAIHYTVEEQADQFVITMDGDVFAPFVALDLKEADARFSDNFFNLTGTERVITLKKEDIWNTEKKMTLEELERQLTCTSLRDSFSERTGK